MALPPGSLFGSQAITSLGLHLSRDLWNPGPVPLAGTTFFLTLPCPRLTPQTQLKPTSHFHLLTRLGMSFIRLLAKYSTKSGCGRGSHIYKTETKAFPWTEQNSNSPFTKRPQVDVPPGGAPKTPADPVPLSPSATPFSTRSLSR